MPREPNSAWLIPITYTSASDGVPKIPAPLCLPDRDQRIAAFFGLLLFSVKLICSILNSELLKINFKNFSNFEKKFYPKIIKKNKSNFEQIDGFWHSIDNTKDIDNLNKKDDKAKYDRIDRIIKKMKKNEKQFLSK